jgi:hypothetical protein
MIEKFDIDNITQNSYCVGVLTKEVITILNLSLEEKIIIGQDKIRYVEKHKHKFPNYDEYKKHVESTPEVIASPDFVALHPNGKSIEFIKRINKIMLIAVRIKPQGFLWVKSIFSITEAKLKNYVLSGRAKRFD